MTEVRSIRNEEATEFLGLLCEVFELDFQRASTVFTKEPFFDLDRKIALFQAERMVSVLTTVPLQFGWGRAIGIAGVATLFPFRGQGLAEHLLREVLLRAEASGEGVAYLFAKRTDVYERVGFKAIDAVVRGPLQGLGPHLEPVELPFDEVQRRYEAWANQDPRRLRRDDLRWRFWTWNLRLAEPFGEGYLVNEANTIREVIPGPRHWPVSPLDEWLGLRSMAKLLGAPLLEERFEAHLMAYGTDDSPQMFLTDQF